jgi:restriction system protein
MKELFDAVQSLSSTHKLALIYIVAASVAAIVWWHHRRHHKRASHRWRIKSASRVLELLREMGTNKGPGVQFAYLRKIDPLMYEEAVLTSMQIEGHQIMRNDRYTGDGGVDGECVIDGRRFLLQMKRYSGHIDREHLAAFIVICHSRRTRGLFVHTGKTGQGVAAMGLGVVDVVSGQTLLDCLGVVPSTSKEGNWRKLAQRCR